ncbi:MAG: hypothetical protein AB7H43_06165 [Acidimicrobiia bacterium]
MAAPNYVPNTLEEQPRTGLPIPPAPTWRADRPGDGGPDLPAGPGFGIPGPDQGYALKLARGFAGRLQVAGPETVEDAIAGGLAVATKRAAAFGRAPVVHDLEVAFRVWGLLGDAPPELVELRQTLFPSASHHYDRQRAIADATPEATLRLTHQEVARRFPADWRALLGG